MKNFDSFTDFTLFMGGVLAVQAQHDHEMLESIGKAVENRAKLKIGDYQNQTGPFVAWAGLADSTQADRERQGYPEDEPGLRSGEMRASIEHQVIGPEAHIGSNDDNLVYFELGTSKQPPRSVLGGALFEVAPEIVEKIGEQVVLALEGKGVFQGKMIIEPE